MSTKYSYEALISSVLNSPFRWGWGKKRAAREVAASADREITSLQQALNHALSHNARLRRGVKFRVEARQSIMDGFPVIMIRSAHAVRGDEFWVYPLNLPGLSMPQAYRLANDLADLFGVLSVTGLKDENTGEFHQCTSPSR